MIRAKAYPIATVNGTVEFDLPGNYFKLLVASRAVDVELLNDGSPALSASQVAAGFYQRVNFNKLRITDTGAQNIVVLAAPDEGGQDSFTGSVSLLGAAHTDTSKTATGASTQCLAANASRKYLGISVPATAAAGVYIRTDGGAAVAGAGSIYCGPAQLLEFLVTPTGQINMIREGGANIDFTVIEA